MSVTFYLAALAIAVIISIVIACISFSKIKTDLKQKMKSDISVEQEIQTEKIISEFLKRNHLEPGSPIKNIAEKLYIVYGGESDAILDRAFLSEPDKNGMMTVLVKKGLSEEDHLFDFAHECWHRINRDPTPATRPEGTNKSEIEQLADYGGAALLMPIEKVYSFLVEENYKTCSVKKKQEIIQALCSRYGVTQIIALRRIKEIFEIKQYQSNFPT